MTVYSSSQHLQGKFDPPSHVVCDSYTTYCPELGFQGKALRLCKGYCIPAQWSMCLAIITAGVRMFCNHTCNPLAGIQSASNTLSSDTNTNPAMLGAAHARGPCPPGGHPHPHPGHPHPRDCILIDSSSLWDGPHPGLSAALGTPGNLRARTGPAPAPLGIVRLPANMIAARAKHVRPVRHSRHQSSGAALQNGSSHHADLQSDAHRQEQT